MNKIGILTCIHSNNVCARVGCLAAFQNRTDFFQDYPEETCLVNNPVPVSLLSGDRKPQIRFLGNHHSGSGNLYHKSFRM